MVWILDNTEVPLDLKKTLNVRKIFIVKLMVKYFKQGNLVSSNPILKQDYPKNKNGVTHLIITEDKFIK